MSKKRKKQIAMERSRIANVKNSQNKPGQGKKKRKPKKGKK